MDIIYFFFFFQAEDGIRDLTVTGVQTCALPISPFAASAARTPIQDPIGYRSRRPRVRAGRRGLRRRSRRHVRPGALGWAGAEALAGAGPDGREAALLLRRPRSVRVRLRAPSAARAPRRSPSARSSEPLAIPAGRRHPRAALDPGGHREARPRA